MPDNVKTRLTAEGYHILISSLSKDRLTNLINDLTVAPYKLDATKEDIEKSKFPVFKYSKDRKEIIVPRYYGINKFGLPLGEDFDPEETDFEFLKELRDIQKIVSDKCINYMKKNGGGLLSVPCGFGKTVCALYIAQKLGLKTLVVVHKSFLINQWIERALEFLSIDMSRIGVIRQNKCTAEGKDLVIGMIHTIAKREYKNIFDKFGLVIYDEAHHVACKFFSKALLKTGAQYTLALTATPYRGDGLIKVMYWFLGGTVYREKVKINKNVMVKLINYKSTDKKLFSLKKRWMLGKMRVDTGRMTTNICMIDSRNQKLIDTINHIRRTEPERKILVLSGRKSHLDVIKKGVDEAIQEDIDAGILDEGEVYSCYYIGETKPVDRREAEERGDIIFATYEMANEGLDIKHLNTVLLASPKRDVLQSIGRIMRKILTTGDVRPLIIDFADDIGALGSWLKTRIAIYTKCKYEIENFYLINDKFKTSCEYSGIKMELGDMHHPDPYINKIINQNNVIMNDWKDAIKQYKSICTKIDQVLGLEPDINGALYHSPILDSEYKVLSDLEYTNIADILFVPKLTDADFDRTIVKDADNDNGKLDIEADMAHDKEDEEMEVSIMQSVKKKEKGFTVPKKRLF
jgi:superfamily II DNA or RNA helicase